MKKILILIAFLCSTSLAYSQLTLEDAIGRALEVNYGIKSYQKKVESKEASVNSAWGRYLPSLNFDITYNYIDRDIIIDLNPIRTAMITLQSGNQVALSNLESVLKTGAPLSAEQQLAVKQGATAQLNQALPGFKETLKERAFPKAQLTMNQPIFTGGKISAGVKAAEAQKDMESERLKSEIQDLTTSVISTYLSILMAKENLQVRKDALATIEKHNQRAEGLLKQGLIAPHDKLRAEVALSEAKRNLFEAEELLKIANLALYSVLDTSGNISVGGSLTYKQIDKEVDYFISLAKSQNHTLMQIKSGSKALEAKSYAEKANYFPTIYGFGMYDVFDHYRSGIDPKWAIGIGANFTLFNGLRRTNDIQAAQAEAESMSMLSREVERKIELAVRKHFMEMRLAEYQYRMLNSSLEQAQENFRLNEKRYETGLGTSIELLDAGLSLEAVKLKRNSALKDYYSNLAILLQYCGNSKQFISIWNN